MIKFFSWLGTLASIVGAFMVATKIVFLGYCLFIIGSVSWLFVGIKNRDMPLIVLNGTFLLANLVGLYNSF